MSNWMQLKHVRVRDLDVFQEVAKGYDCSVEEIVAGREVRITDLKGRHRNCAYLRADEHTKTRGLYLEMDNDPRYSTLAARLGPSLGNLTRDYAIAAVKKGFLRGGRHLIRSVKEQENGLVIMKVAVNG